MAAFALLPAELRVTADTADPARPRTFTRRLSHHRGAVGTFREKSSLTPDPDIPYFPFRSHLKPRSLGASAVWGMEPPGRGPSFLCGR